MLSTSVPAFTSDSRLMLIAPHPDDEALGCGILLQQAVCAGAAVRVVYATDGDNNPWPQRVLERKWRLNAADRKRWGKLRRAEALAALSILGVHRSDARFLGLPDQGLTGLLTTDCRSTLGRLATSIGDWSPTDLLIPSIHDAHPDHSALGVMLRLTLANLHPCKSQMSFWAYAVHGNSEAFFGRARKLSQSSAERVVKEKAIHSHKTQLMLSRRRFLGYATRPERFLKLESSELAHADGAIRRVSKTLQVLRVKLRLPAKPMAATDATFFVLGHDMAGRVRCLRVHLPVRSSAVEIFDCRTRERVDLARYRGNAFAGELAIPVGNFSPAHALFMKLERRSWFFDEGGWLETPPIQAETTIAKIAKTESMGAEVLS